MNNIDMINKHKENILIGKNLSELENWSITKCLKEIKRVGKGQSFITLGSYTNEDNFWLFKNWSVLGSTILHQDDWKEVLKHINYQGDYKFVGSKSLKLRKA